jgi:hypothetical protein
MFALKSDCHANVANVAMKIINPQSFSYSTNSTVMAMVNVFSRIIVPKFAFSAIVFGNVSVTTYANLACRLDFGAVHAHHCFNQISS